MRQIALALLFASPLLATGCNKNSAENASANMTGNPADSTYYAISGGGVTGDRASGINGSFRITEASGPDTGVASNGQGGACIIFRAEDLGYQMPSSCTRNENCKDGSIQGYCHPVSHQCWARPPAFPDPLCRRSIDPDAPPQWPVDQDLAIKQNPPPIPVPAALHRNAQAVVVACLKWDKQRGSCGGPQSMIKWGQPTPIP